MTLGTQGHALIKEAKRTGNELVPFNEHAVRSLVRELKFLLQEITQTLESTRQNNIALDQPTTAKIQLLHNTVKHYKRCLIAYELKRIEILEKNWAFLVDGPDRALLSPAEVEFVSEYGRTIQLHYHEKFPSLDWNGVDAIPPEDLYVMVRVLEDCGEVLTENGVLVLYKGAVMNVLRSDINPLLSSGHIELL